MVLVAATLISKKAVILALHIARFGYTALLRCNISTELKARCAELCTRQLRAELGSQSRSFKSCHPLQTRKWSSTQPSRKLCHISKLRPTWLTPWKATSLLQSNRAFLRGKHCTRNGQLRLFFRYFTCYCVEYKLHRNACILAKCTTKIHA